MFRKLILSAVMTTGTLTGLNAAAGAADAHPPTEFHHRRFEVLVLCGHCWEVRGVYRDRCDAEHAAHRLHREGFRVEIREF